MNNFSFFVHTTTSLSSLHPKGPDPAIQTVNSNPNFIPDPVPNRAKGVFFSAIFGIGLDPRLVRHYSNGGTKKTPLARLGGICRRVEGGSSDNGDNRVFLARVFDGVSCVLPNLDLAT